MNHTDAPIQSTVAKSTATVPTCRACLCSLPLSAGNRRARSSEPPSTTTPQSGNKNENNNSNKAVSGTEAARITSTSSPTIGNKKAGVAQTLCDDVALGMIRNITVPLNTPVLILSMGYYSPGALGKAMQVNFMATALP